MCPQIDKRKVGLRVSNALQRLGMSQTALAKELELRPQSVQAWCAGVTIPSTDYIPRLAKLLGISVSELLLVDESPLDSPAANVAAFNLEHFNSQLKRLASTYQVSINTVGEGTVGVLFTGNAGVILSYGVTQAPSCDEFGNRIKAALYDVMSAKLNASKKVFTVISSGHIKCPSVTSELTVSAHDSGIALYWVERPETLFELLPQVNGGPRAAAAG